MVKRILAIPNFGRRVDKGNKLREAVYATTYKGGTL